MTSVRRRGKLRQRGAGCRRSDQGAPCLHLGPGRSLDLSRGRCGYWHHGSAALELPAISMKKQCATCGQPIEAFASEVLGTLVKCPGPHGGPATSRSIL